MPSSSTNPDKLSLSSSHNPLSSTMQNHYIIVWAALGLLESVCCWHPRQARKFGGCYAADMSRGGTNSLLRAMSQKVRRADPAVGRRDRECGNRMNWDRDLAYTYTQPSCLAINAEMEFAAPAGTLSSMSKEMSCLPLGSVLVGSASQAATLRASRSPGRGRQPVMCSL